MATLYQCDRCGNTSKNQGDISNVRLDKGAYVTYMVKQSEFELCRVCFGDVIKLLNTSPPRAA